MLAADLEETVDTLLAVRVAVALAVVAACMGAQKSFAPAPMPTPPGGAACGGLCLVAASSLRLWQAVSVSVWGLPKM